MRFEAARRYDASVEVVWDVITDPELYAAVAPNLSRVEVLSGADEGMIRECADTGGQTWTETCTVWEPRERYAVEVHVDDSEFHRRLFHSFGGEWSIEARADEVVVTMAFEYEPRYGPLGWVVGKLLEREGRDLTRTIFDGWERELETRLDAPGTP